jgi:DNA-binding response OmpR family regulator
MTVTVFPAPPVVPVSGLSRLGDLQIFSEHSALDNQLGNRVILRRREFQLFRFLVNNLNRVVEKMVLLDLIWQYESFCGSNTLEVHLSALRKKLQEVSSSLIIETVRGVGYRLSVREPLSV